MMRDSQAYGAEGAQKTRTGMFLRLPDSKKVECPFIDDSNPLISKSRNPGNLNEVQVTPPNVNMMRHHQYPDSNLRACWNRTIEVCYQDNEIQPGDNLKESLQAMIDFVEKHSDRWAKGLTDGAKVIEVLTKMKNKEVYHDGNAARDSDLIEALWEIVTWPPANIIVGPKAYAKGDASKVGRTDDPSDGNEEGLVNKLDNDEAKRAIRGIYNSGKALLQGTFERTGLDKVEDYYRDLKVLLAEGVKNPKFQDVKNSDWIMVVKPGELYVPDAEAAKIKSGGDPPSDKKWFKNETPCLLFRVEGTRSRWDPKLPSFLGAQSVPSRDRNPAEADADSITIDGQEVSLYITYTADDGSAAVYREGSADNIHMGALLAYIGEQWSGLAVPDFLGSLNLQRLTVQTVNAPGILDWWRFSLAVETTLNSVPVEMVFSVDHEADYGYSFEAFLIFWNGDEPTYFRGDYSTSGGVWEIDASMNTGTPVSLTQLAKSLGIPVGDIPDGLDSLVPEISEASFLYRSGTDGIISVTAQTKWLEAVLARITSANVAGWVAMGGVRIQAALSQLPLVGGGVSDSEDLVVDTIGLAWASSGLTANQITEVNREIFRISPTLPQFPDPPNGTEFSGSLPLVIAALRLPGPQPRTLALPL
ncbi:hypothetical protein [Streptomyces sp. BA2]|uniref:hypothetical protein n=1 Tax=Streptomyces sp. BA2 TaxID=436595 RepID=UPI0013282264|nr:hypothetical protein [Streptomyces sp. BA2]MWA07771.1 hypothetical protein [Streptomyces sp. BA2]